MNYMGGDIQNTNIERDSGEVKGCNQRGRPCTACVDGLNCVKLQHNEGIRWTTFQCLLDAILELTRCDHWFWQAYWPTCMCMPLVHSSRYVSHRETSIRCSPGEVGPTAVYLPSWIRVNSVHKVANATLQFMSRPRRLIETKRLFEPNFYTVIWYGNKLTEIAKQV